MGLIRLFLACGVVLAHGQDQALGPLNELKGLELSIDPLWTFNVLGGRSVIYFYIVSGFLISFVLHTKYPETGKGTRAFFWSRFLRIYPLWWALLIAAPLLGEPWGAVHA